MTKKSDWAERFALKRRAIDRKLLAECERNLPDMPLEAPRLAPEPPISFEGPSPRQERDDARAAIARAFGRPLR